MANIIVLGEDASTGRFKPVGPSDTLVRTDGSMIAVTPIPFGGDGVLGDVTLGTSSLSGVQNYHNLTISGGATITVPAMQPLHIKCTGNFVNGGTIDAAGAGFAGAQAPLTDFTAGASTTAQGWSGGGGGGGSTDHVSGNWIGGAGSPTAFRWSGAPAAGGTAAGSAGSAGVSAAGSPAGFLGYGALLLLPGGGGGSGSNADIDGTDGGAGGGVVVVEVRGNITEGVISANGAHGVNGGTSFSNGTFVGGSGGGGGGGFIVILWGGARTPGTVTVAGGAGGTAPTNGGAGALGGAGGIGGAGLIIRQHVAT